MSYGESDAFIDVLSLFLAKVVVKQKRKYDACAELDKNGTLVLSGGSGHLTSQMGMPFC